MTGSGNPLLHPLLAARWSPTSFDPDHGISAVEVDYHRGRALGAFCWQLTAVGVHRRTARDRDARADGAPPCRQFALVGADRRHPVANLCHRYVEDTDWDYSEFAMYHLGQAVAHMTFQAQSLGLFARQFRAFDRAALAGEFGVPAHWEISTMTAFGRVPPGCSDHSDDAPRGRRALNHLQWPPGAAAP